MTEPNVDESLQPATWNPPVADSEVREVEEWLTHPIPTAWRQFVQRERWLGRGWLRSGAFVHLQSPAQARELMRAWDESLEVHPGYYQLGDDGSRMLFCVDLRDETLGVLLTDITAGGWEEAESTGLSVEQFVAQIDDGSFDPLALGD